MTRIREKVVGDVINSEQDLDRKWPAILRNQPDFIKTILALSGFASQYCNGSRVPPEIVAAIMIAWSADRSGSYSPRINRRKFVARRRRLSNARRHANGDEGSGRQTASAKSAPCQGGPTPFADRKWSALVKYGLNSNSWARQRFRSMTAQWLEIAADRAQFEADLAQRRFIPVDPGNRLVADTLEAEWDDKSCNDPDPAGTLRKADGNPD